MLVVVRVLYWIGQFLDPQTSLVAHPSKNQSGDCE